MHSVTTHHVLKNAAASLGHELGELGSTDGTLGPADARLVMTWINRRCRFAWEYYFWPELCEVEPRQFRPTWLVGTTYGASSVASAVERYYPPARRYYQSLRASNTGNAPATGADYTENSAYWAECRPGYTGNDYAAGTFTVGTIVYYPTDGYYYQCHTAHTGTATLDVTKFGQLRPFQRNIDFEQSGETVIGEVPFDGITAGDPRVVGGQVPIKFGYFDDGLIVYGSEPIVYVRFRKRPSEFTSTPYLAATTYALNALAYDSTTTGNTYKSLQAANVGHALTDTAWWESVPFPYRLAEYCAQGAASDYLLKQEGNIVRYGTDEDQARDLLDRELDKLERAAGQSRQMTVC